MSVFDRSSAYSLPNNFDALRFWAALAVLWSHSFPATAGTEETEPLFRLSGGQTTGGTISVAVFFAISGFLITRSFDRSSSAWRYVKARALRIMPALLAVLFLTAFVIGPIVTRLPVHDYLTSSAPYRYVAIQSTFVGFLDRLPGVFTDNPHPSVNGALWTLRFEVECYALVFLLGIAGVLNRYVTLALYVAGLVFLAFTGEIRSIDGLHLPSHDNHVDLGTKFLAGALIYQWAPALKARWAWMCGAIAVATLWTAGFTMALRTVVPYLVLYLAIGCPFRIPGLQRYGDLSYGIYIYAWPVKQLIIMNMAQPHWLVVASIATPIVLGLAYLSWHGIEKVALSLKDRRLSLLPAGWGRQKWVDSSPQPPPKQKLT